MDDRRRFLTTAGVTVVASLAGCSDLGQQSTADEGTDLPTVSDSCDTVSLPAGEYPELPSSVSGESARTFVEAFERSYARAKVEQQSEKSFGGFDGRRTEIRRQTDDGYVVSVEIRVDYAVKQSDEATRTDLGSESFDAVYYVSEGFASRSAGDRAETASTRTWETVACRGG